MFQSHKKSAEGINLSIYNKISQTYVITSIVLQINCLRISTTLNRLIFQLCFIMLKMKLYVCRNLCENFRQVACWCYERFGACVGQLSFACQRLLLLGCIAIYCSYFAVGFEFGNECKLNSVIFNIAFDRVNNWLMYCRFAPNQGRTSLCCLYVAVYGSWLRCVTRSTHVCIIHGGVNYLNSVPYRCYTYV